MIQLIASDMDGTLLDGESRLPSSFDKTMELIKRRNCTFVPASGRSYPKQRDLFLNYLDDIYFICDNGACVYYQDKPLHVQGIPKQSLLYILELCETIPDIAVILCGERKAYHKEFLKNFIPFFTTYYIDDIIVNDYSEVDEEILKVAVCDLRGAGNNSYQRLGPLLGDTFALAVSGMHWMDIMAEGVNKGAALQFIQQRLGISRSHTMAFGDYYNDVEMLSRAEYSYVMENANKDMRKYARYIAPSNLNNGVQQVISQALYKSIQAKECHYGEKLTARVAAEKIK